MLRVTVELVSGDDGQSELLGWLTIGNVTDRLQDADGTADYSWSAFQGGRGQTGVPLTAGLVEGHARSEGWERLAAVVMAQVAETRAATRRSGRLRGLRALIPGSGATPDPERR